MRHIIRIPGGTLGARIFNLDLEADVLSIDPYSTTALHYTSWADVISMNDTADGRSIMRQIIQEHPKSAHRHFKRILTDASVTLVLTKIL